MRVVAGRLRGRRLVTPKGSTTRPTSDRVREALFSSLGSRLGSWEGLSVLDAFAGSGALGIEALSRGASTATFIEKDSSAFRALRTNLETLGLLEVATTLPGDALARSTIARLSGPFTLLLLDPPYRIDKSEVTGLIEALLSSGGLAEGAVIVWEHGAEDHAQWPRGVTPLAARRYGSTCVDFAVAGGDEEG